MSVIVHPHRTTCESSFRLPAAACLLRTACALALLACPAITAVETQPGTPAGNAPAVPAGAPVSAETPVSPQEMGFEEIVFVKRKPYSSDHYYTDIDNGTSPDRFQPDNGIYIYNLRTRMERAVITAAKMPGGKGFIGKPSLSFDAKKIIFDFRQDPGSGFRIWEVGIDGTGLRQVSFPPKDEAEKAARWAGGWHTDDIHPCYLPDGDIIFSSTRCEHTVLCGGSSALVAPVLHRMDADGSNVEQLTRSLVSEFCPVILHDGRVMYHRWEYVDRGARVAKTVWAVNPDGSRPQELYGMADDDTTIYMYPQPLPGNERKFVCVGTCHFPQGGCFGAVMLVDYGMGVRERAPDPDEKGYIQGDGRYPVVNITPQVFIQRRSEPGWRFVQDDGKCVDDRNGRQGHLYTHPYPVNERQFLVSYKVNAADHYKDVANAYAIYLIDNKGLHRPVHADPNLSCWHPVPLVAKPVPPLVPTSLDAKYAVKNQALCILADVTRGMAGVVPGQVKWLRINEAVPRYWSTGRRWSPSVSSSSWKASLWPRVQWGVVPVEKDGSAHFVVPAGRNIFYQALDDNFREIQRERTYVNYAPGEVRSCAGCHAQSGSAGSEPAAVSPLALNRPPSIPQPQPCDLKDAGGDGNAGQVIHYPTDIQPVFDAKCVSCHGPKDPAGGLKLTGETTHFYNTSYEELASKELAGPLISEFTSFRKGDQGNYNGAYLPPGSLGCPASKLMAVLTDPAHPMNAKDNHCKMLTKMQLMVVSRWVDSNYQYYGSYFGRQHPKWITPDPAVPAYDPADFRRKATFEESIGFHAPPWHR
jgi:mono/diheme cytochrome c family protein